MRWAFLLAAWFAFLCGAMGAAARAADSGDCGGVMGDGNGVGVAAAEITVQSSEGRNFRTETDGAGRFTLRNLAAGEYKIEARKEGFFVLAGQTVTLRAGANELTLTLQHAEELHEQVQVTAPANQIDPQDTTKPETITAREIRDIHVPHTHILQQS